MKTSNEKTPPQGENKKMSNLRMSSVSTVVIKKDDKWVWLDTGEEVKNPPKSLGSR